MTQNFVLVVKPCVVKQGFTTLLFANREGELLVSGD
jgi:hypothetical protein